MNTTSLKTSIVLTGHFLLCVLVAFVFASVFHSQFVIAELMAINITVPMSARLDMTFSDLIGLLPGYGSIMLVALLLGFLIINGITRWVIALPEWRYIMAGFIAIGVALLAMHPIFHISLIAGARSAAGILSQCFAGAIGGYLFMKLRSRP